MNISTLRPWAASRTPAGSAYCPISRQVRYVGGNISSCFSSTSRTACMAGRQVTWSDSVETSRVRWPSGRSAAKNHVRKRRGSKTGVSQAAHTPSRSVRNTRPRRSRNSVKASSRASRAARSVSQLSPVGSATTVSADSPASSTPDSSKVSRTAAHTSARAVASSVPSRAAHWSGAGPVHATAWSKSRASTPPPGKTHIPPAKAIEVRRRSTTVAALRGSAGSRLPSANARAPSTSSGGSCTRCIRSCLGVLATRSRTPSWKSRSDLHDQLDLDGGVERQHRHADRRACVPTRLTEDLAEQLGDAVGHQGLAGEVGSGSDEHDHLDDPLDRGELADLGTDSRDRIERALARALHGLLLAHLATDLAGEHQLSVAHGQLAGGEDVVDAVQGRDVRRHRCGHLGNAEPEAGEPLLRRLAHGRSKTRHERFVERFTGRDA